MLNIVAVANGATRFSSNSEWNLLINNFLLSVMMYQAVFQTAGILERTDKTPQVRNQHSGIVSESFRNILVATLKLRRIKILQPFPDIIFTFNKIKHELLVPVGVQ